jgi:TRAP-type C4-dicarboxylate transport system permease large subunit
MLGLLAAGTAVAYALGASSVLAFIASGNAQYLAIVPQRIFSQIDVFALMAMPLFILAGEIMNRAGITKALVDFAMAMLGRLKGGLGHVNIMASVFFAGISGSAVADAAALSNTLVPAMVARGYKPLYAAAITAASSVIGPDHPAVDRDDLLRGGDADLGGGTVRGRRRSRPAAGGRAVHGQRLVCAPRRPPRRRRRRHSGVLAGLLARLARPVAAGHHPGWHRVRCRHAHRGSGTDGRRGAGGGPVVRRPEPADLSRSLVQTAALTGAIFMILGAVACFSWLAGHEQLPQRLAGFVTELGLGQTEYLLVINLIFVVAGMVLDPPVALALLVPLLGPPAIALGVDPVHLGIVLCLNLTIGLITPPVGGCLLAVSTVCKVEYWALARAIFPFAIMEVLLLLVIALVPELSLFLPRLVGLL